MSRDDYIDAHFSGALHEFVEIIHLEPQQHAVPVRLVIPISDRAVMMFHGEAMQLQY